MMGVRSSIFGEGEGSHSHRWRSFTQHLSFAPSTIQNINLIYHLYITYLIIVIQLLATISSRAALDKYMNHPKQNKILSFQ